MRDIYRRLDKIESQLAALINAFQSGDVCGNLGHTYRLPDLAIRRRVELSDWEIERRCERCGTTDGSWKPEHWTLPKFAAERAARVPQPKVMA